MSVEEALVRSLKDSGFALVRSKKHLCYKDGLGRLFVTASTPSDRLASENSFAAFKKLVPSATKCVDSRPLRSRRTKTRLEPLPVEPTVVVPALPLEPMCTCGCGLTKSAAKREAKESRLLARWEAEEREAKRQHELLRSAFEKSLWVMHNLFWDDYTQNKTTKNWRDSMVRAAMDLYSTLKLQYFAPVVMVGELKHDEKVFAEILAVRQSGFYLDVVNNGIHDAPSWNEEIDGETFKTELYAELCAKYDRRRKHWIIGQEEQEVEQNAAAIFARRDAADKAFDGLEELVMKAKV